MLKSKASIRHYVGIDPSATGTGVAVLTITPTETIRTSVRISIPKCNGPERLYLLCKAFHNFIIAKTDIMGQYIQSICIEAPSLRSTNRADTLGQVRGALNVTCMNNDLGIPKEIPPTSLKKFFTERGQADKENMIAAAVKLGWNLKTDDEADAAALAELAWALDTPEELSLTRKQIEAIVGIQHMGTPKQRPPRPVNKINI